jgi:hypothetical protein
MRQAVNTRTLLCRAAQPDEMIEMALYLCSRLHHLARPSLYCRDSQTAR